MEVSCKLKSLLQRLHLTGSGCLSRITDLSESQVQLWGLESYLPSAAKLWQTTSHTPETQWKAKSQLSISKLSLALLPSKEFSGVGCISLTAFSCNFNHQPPLATQHAFPVLHSADAKAAGCPLGPTFNLCQPRQLVTSEVNIHRPASPLKRHVYTKPMLSRCKTLRPH